LLGSDAPTLLGNNYVPKVQSVARVESGKTYCQGRETIPAGTAAVQVLVETYGKTTDSLLLTVLTEKGDVAATGRTNRGHERITFVEAEIPEFKELISNATICFKNEGKNAIALSGVASEKSEVVNIDGNKVDGRAGINYLKGGDVTWFGYLPTVAKRYGVAKAGFIGDWTFWFAAALFFVAAFIAIGVAVKGVNED